ncbi:MAG: restriction endonuclease [Bacteroidales bacterium]|nr:restriction endonuclease [Bacteroidales bacterium]
MLKLPENYNVEISSKEFELLVKDYLLALGKDLISFEATHNAKIRGTDGEYQIDIVAKFTILNVEFQVLIECKRYAENIKREVVQILFDKIRSTGSHKAIIFASSGFQKGAIKYAKDHGIALVRIIEGEVTYLTKSNGHGEKNPPPWAVIPKYVGEYLENNTFYYLQRGSMEPLMKFLFNEEQNS